MRVYSHGCDVMIFLQCVRAVQAITLFFCKNGLFLKSASLQKNSYFDNIFF